MIYILLLWMVVSVIAILFCYSEAKKYHYTVKLFLEECLMCTIFFPITILFLASKLIEFFKTKLPIIKISTDFITEFLNKKL